jgi:SAM-dependent methyltransferase
MKTYLNLGCGRSFHVSWTNLDFAPASSEVIKADLRQGIPLHDASFEVVYHSHVLEHFAKSAAPSFLRECFRVLRPGGIIRVAVPDLEQIATQYLNALAGALNGDELTARNYEWMVLELYDQTVRERSGGAMLEYLRLENLPNRDFILNRLGAEARSVIEHKENDHPANESRSEAGKPSWFARGFRRLFRMLRREARSHEDKLKRLLGSEYELLKTARFRAGGEIHLWMYDRHSLSRLLRDVGFLNPTVQSAAESRIPNWRTYCLDAEADGAVRKPDSLFMEATRP